ncbi:MULTISPECIES: glycosyltransferase [unclassified Leeuwenhoekiella]|mgnify:CR=1 FL=1|uniref:glycosyltransferase n=1 Tax=unclassified Leeuwenhoekiella TaxID=2615029 RepID=UPI000C5BC00A|nr:MULTISPECIES: glycosyltransferase [unclassified Leeuwenhoekiella]MAW96654.1 hypothetical protein [Leeuwenhoekiella sp.]MBA81543.1 hypothetical protein [Leeuwenhoekiella sp.]|tara:strand:+ start:21590 stop:22690 length:1101 start_codon:yes stop_codon:yes gene_type:complete
MLNIALFSPNKNPYSETFIQAQKKGLSGKVFYYYGSGDFFMLEGEERNIVRLNKLQKFRRRFFKAQTTFLRAENIAASLRKKKIDVILIQYGNHAFSLLPALKAAKLPFIVHFHGYDASVNDIIINSGGYKEVFERCKYCVAVSEVMYNQLLKLGCPDFKLILNTYGPDPSFLKIEPKFFGKQIIGIGRFVNKKAPHLSILAFAKVVEKHPDAQLLLAGSGVLYNCCIDLAQALNIEDKIRFLGVISPTEYRMELSRSVCFIQHSKTAQNGDMEGTPLAVLEASAAGVPIISTNHAGIPDVVEHGKTGLLCAEGDVDAMAENIIYLLDNPQIVKDMGQAGKIIVKKYFTMERYISSLNEIIEKARA